MTQEEIKQYYERRDRMVIAALEKKRPTGPIECPFCRGPGKWCVTEPMEIPGVCGSLSRVSLGSKIHPLIGLVHECGFVYTFNLCLLGLVDQSGAYVWDRT